jgi:RHS repeat-associated protein
LKDTPTNVSLGSVSTDRNSDFNVSSQTVNGITGAASQVNYSYDNDLLLTGVGAESITRHAMTGLIASTTLDSSNDAFTYNSFGELTDYVVKHGATDKFAMTITRDALGRVATKSETMGSTTNAFVYTYDSAGRLTATTKNGAPFNSYSYDSNSNRTGGSQNGVAVSATYDDQDRLTSYNGFTYSYNAAGDLLTKTVTATSAVTTYDYDVFGNLRSVALPTKTISYSHDALNRRVTRKDGSTVTARYLYDNRRLIAELTPAGVIAKRYVYSTKSNVPDFVVMGSDTYRMISDQIGTVRMVVNASTGAIAQQIDYDEFGKVSSDSSPGFQNFGFAGGMYDLETKLVRFGARDYDAETGRWTVKDPIGFGGGDTNLYGYVMQDPVNFTDPSGLYLGGNNVHEWGPIDTLINAWFIWTQNPAAGALWAEYFLDMLPGQTPPRPSNQCPANGGKRPGGPGAMPAIFRPPTTPYLYDWRV